MFFSISSSHILSLSREGQRVKIRKEMKNKRDKYMQIESNADFLPNTNSREMQVEKDRLKQCQRKKKRKRDRDREIKREGERER